MQDVNHLKFMLVKQMKGCPTMLITSWKARGNRYFDIQMVTNSVAFKLNTEVI